MRGSECGPGQAPRPRPVKVRPPLAARAPGWRPPLRSPPRRRPRALVRKLQCDPQRGVRAAGARGRVPEAQALGGETAAPGALAALAARGWRGQSCAAEVADSGVCSGDARLLRRRRGLGRLGPVSWFPAQGPQASPDQTPPGGGGRGRHGMVLGEDGFPRRWGCARALGSASRQPLVIAALADRFSVDAGDDPAMTLPRPEIGAPEVAPTPAPLTLEQG